MWPRFDFCGLEREIVWFGPPGVLEQENRLVLGYRAPEHAIRGQNFGEDLLSTMRGCYPGSQENVGTVSAC